MINQSLIKNPLTVIAIFASLTEIVCGLVTPFITDLQNQQIFLIFVIGFPVLLIILFFITLNFNHKVLYSPSDFGDGNENIAALFYGNITKKKSNKTSRDSSKTSSDSSKTSNDTKDKSNDLIRKSNSLNDFIVSEIDSDFKPYYEFANEFYDTIEKLLPLDKISEINFDLKNKQIYTLEIRIKPEYTKENEKSIEIFILYIYEALKIEEKKEVSKEKSLEGLLAGSGIDQAKAIELGFYVVKTIKDRII